MQWLRRPFCHGVLLLLLGMLCWYGALGVCSLYGQQGNGERVSYREPDSQQEFTALKELRRQMKLSGEGEVTGWGQSLSEEITAEATSDATRVDVIWLDGSAPLVWALPLVKGQFPGKTDALGCALDEKTALKLFGSLDIVGKEVQIAGERMTVRGVFTLPQGLAAIPSDPGRGLAFCPAVLAGDSVRMAALEFIVRPGPGKTAKEQAEDWMQAAAMSMGGSLDDHRDTRQLLALFTAMPGYLLMVLSLAELYSAFIALTKAAWSRWTALKSGRSASSRQLGRTGILWCMLALVFLLAGIGVIRLPAYGTPVPASFLPTRWSDFGFWSEKAERLLQQHVQGRLFPALRPDLEEQGLAAACIRLSLVSLLFLWLARRTLKRGYPQATLASVSACGATLILAAPLFLWLVGRAGWIPTLLPGIPYLPIVFYAVFTALRSARQSEKVYAWLWQVQSGGMHM